jgi:hypothetical protein
MKKIPFTRLYHSDFLALTSGLTDSQVGKLVRLLAQRGMGFDQQEIPKKIQEIFKILSERQNEDVEKYEAQILKSQKGASARAKRQEQQQAILNHCQPEPEPEPIAAAHARDSDIHLNSGFRDLSGQTIHDITPELVAEHFPAMSAAQMVASLDKWRVTRLTRTQRAPDWLQDAIDWLNREKPPPKPTGPPKPERKFVNIC